MYREKSGNPGLAGHNVDLCLGNFVSSFFLKMLLIVIDVTDGHYYFS
jgi:hypothetical protein